MSQKCLNNLTNAEFGLISSDYYPLLKKSAMAKVKSQLLELAMILEKEYPLPVGASFKITQGDSHKDLPFLVLDYPSLAFTSFDYLIRVFFWWGRHISCQLYVKKEWEGGRDLMVKKGDLQLVGESIWENSPEAYVATGLEGKLLANTNHTHHKVIRVMDIKNPDQLFEAVPGFFKDYYRQIIPLKGS